MYRVIRGSEDIFAMSMKQSDFAADIESQTRQVCRHFIKIYLYPTAQEVNHWVSELHRFLHNVPYLKHNKKLPSRKLILDNTIYYSDNLRLLQYWYDDIIADYSDTHTQRKDSDFNELKDLVIQYWEWIACELSERGQVSVRAIRNELDFLGL